ncbi:hypothetical protein IC229_16170 [Spirosoma sp. BT702]|uniref:Uncharacterized protein n=1 Tax=Spirosoma profusum TaxID=2771354 RepID=A0A926XX26_9BACT|nr:hypothetical protein [Spirosoma profusum]MBD2702189.1 hypothetical protein [Spirosoma profusum]
MKATFIALLLFCNCLVNAQSNDSTVVRSVYGSTNTELKDLMSFIGVEKFRLELNDPKLAGKYFHLTCQEYKNGIAQPEQEMFGFGTRKEILQIDSTGKFTIDVYARTVDPTTIEALFKLPKVSQRKTFKVEADDARRFSFRTDVVAYKNEKARIPMSKKILFFVHSLPYLKDGFYLYCAVAESQVPVNEWHKQFGVKHVIAYNLILE